MNTIVLPGFAASPTRFLFFTRKGGVGKTSLPTAIRLAGAGQGVLLISTVAASNLDEMQVVPDMAILFNPDRSFQAGFGVAIRPHGPKKVTGNPYSWLHR